MDLIFACTNHTMWYSVKAFAFTCKIGSWPLLPHQCKHYFIYYQWKYHRCKCIYEHNIQGGVQRSVQRLKVTICQGKLAAFFLQCLNNVKAKLTLGVNRLNHHLGHIYWFMMVSIRYCQRFELISPKQRHNLQNQSSYAFF